MRRCCRAAADDRPRRAHRGDRAERQWQVDAAAHPRRRSPAARGDAHARPPERPPAVPPGPRSVDRARRRRRARGCRTTARVLADLLATHPVGEERARTLLGSLLFSGDDTPQARRRPERRRAGAPDDGQARDRGDATCCSSTSRPTTSTFPPRRCSRRALVKYPGAMVLVTHDRALIDAVATRTWAIEDGGIREVLGGYSALQKARDRERRK